jgi:hypothetical protein
MTQHIEVTAKTVVTINLSSAAADKLERSLGRALEAFYHMDPSPRYTALVNTGTMDDLLALRLALTSVAE